MDPTRLTEARRALDDAIDAEVRRARDLDDDLALWRRLAPLLPFAVSTARPRLIPLQRRPHPSEHRFAHARRLP